MDTESLPEAVSVFAEKIQTYDIPSDGLVLLMDDIAYGDSLGRTAKFPRNSIAFKWADEIRETHLKEIEWSASRTGLINPVAIFEPVELEGTTVSRASVHNISIMEALELGEGDVITVYKANMIIPQIAENLTRSGTISIPGHCPVCGGETQIRQVKDVKALYCTNPDCQAKKVKSFALLVSRDALNIDGLSEATLERFIAAGFIHTYADIFHLDRHQEAIVSMEGFGGSVAGGGRYDKMIGKFTGQDTPACGFSIGFERIVTILMEQGGRVEDGTVRKAYLVEKGMDSARFSQIMKQAMDERRAGVQVLVSQMNKNKKFQKEQLGKEGYTEFVEFYREALK